MAHHATIGGRQTRPFGSRSTNLASVLTKMAMALSVVAAAGAAQPAEGGVRVCPRDYTLVDLRPAYCANSSGDVVEPVTKHETAASAGCRRGYYRLEGLCLSPETGDVELAETAADMHASR